MWYALLLAACIAGDQLLKYWVVRHLEIGQSAAFLPGLVRLTRLHNTGAAWGSFSGSTALLTAVTAVLLVAVAWLVLKKVIRHGGIAFFLIYFARRNEIYLLDAQVVIEAYEHQEERKSLSYASIVKQGYLIEQGFIPRIRYLDAVDRVYFHEKKQL